MKILTGERGRFGSNKGMLEGNLHSVPLNDVLQALITGQKSGVLTIMRGHHRARVYLDLGRLEVAHLTPGLHLSELMMRMDLLTLLEVQELLAKQGEDNPGTPLGLLALSAGYIDQGDFARVLKAQLLEVLTELSGWTSGNFSFEERSPNASQVPVEHSFDGMALLLEVARRSDTWQHKTDPETVFERSGDPTGAALPPEAWDVLRYVTGKRPAAAIAADIDLPQRQVYYLLHELERHQVIQPAAHPPAQALVLVLSPGHTLQRLINLTLQRAALTPFVAADVVSGADFVLSKQPKAVVIDDVAGEGWAAVKELRDLANYPHLPAVVISRTAPRSGLLGNLFGHLRKPTAHHIQKPFNELELQQLVSKLAGRSLL